MHHFCHEVIFKICSPLVLEAKSSLGAIFGVYGGKIIKRYPIRMINIPLRKQLKPHVKVPSVTCGGYCPLCSVLEVFFVRVA